VLVHAAAFWEFILAVHILAVIAGFGVIFAYPLFTIAGARLDARAIPALHRLQQLIGRRLTNPALGVVLIAGIYLASDQHQWKKFYVGWGVLAVIALGALEGAVIIRGHGKLAELATRDVASAAGGDVTWSPEYQALARRIRGFASLESLIVVVTVVLMSVQA
jgi:uncharacterized membrane protein